MKPSVSVAEAIYIAYHWLEQEGSRPGLWGQRLGRPASPAGLPLVCRVSQVLNVLGCKPVDSRWYAVYRSDNVVRLVIVGQGAIMEVVDPFLVIVRVVRKWMLLIRRDIPALLVDFCRPVQAVPIRLGFPFLAIVGAAQNGCC